MRVLDIVYASAPAGEALINTLELRLPSESVWVCDGFIDQSLGTEDGMKLFRCGNLQIALPAINTTGQQKLKFGLWNVNARARLLIQEALDARVFVPVIYRKYLSSARSAPAERPRTMRLLDSQTQGDALVVECGYYDILNSRWPREIYNSENAPGLRYL